ncbi:DUF4145 domain-containing protein [Clostridium beijerinckii]|uniref:DUF4145 domain-containing protein n=1 Tax=Clostridium beijerinckii TaxID=1520 RepID=A0AAX0B091_CLOBE|nr:DUF4145 domain-containing protein [Clostridium beijerinckii]NRT88720.1 hypothetical protein [Clostridium beijerinckii]NYC74175.1 hypothetical protein [Clostridium beijerinckii]
METYKGRTDYKGWQFTSFIDESSSKSYTCHYCNANTASTFGYWNIDEENFIFICPECGHPTYFDSSGTQYPGVAYGDKIKHIDNAAVEKLYEESRNCMANQCYTATVLCCRKLLMNVSVAKGAAEGLKFVQYVNYLEDNLFIPPTCRIWVDSIRTKGNEATHEIAIMNEREAKLILNFTSMLLKLIYEMPNSITEL